MKPHQSTIVKMGGFCCFYW